MKRIYTYLLSLCVLSSCITENHTPTVMSLSLLNDISSCSYKNSSESSLEIVTKLLDVQAFLNLSAQEQMSNEYVSIRQSISYISSEKIIVDGVEYAIEGEDLNQKGTKWTAKSFVVTCIDEKKWEVSISGDYMFRYYSYFDIKSFSTKAEINIDTEGRFVLNTITREVCTDDYYIIGVGKDLLYNKSRELESGSYRIDIYSPFSSDSIDWLEIEYKRDNAYHLYQKIISSSRDK